MLIYHNHDHDLDYGPLCLLHTGKQIPKWDEDKKAHGYCVIGNPKRKPAARQQ